MKVLTLMAGLCLLGSSSGAKRSLSDFMERRAVVTTEQDSDETLEVQEESGAARRLREWSLRNFKEVKTAAKEVPTSGGRPLTKQELGAYQEWLGRNFKVVEQGKARPLSKEELKEYEEWLAENFKVGAQGDTLVATGGTGTISPPSEESLPKTFQVADQQRQEQSSEGEGLRVHQEDGKGSKPEGQRPMTREEFKAYQSWLHRKLQAAAAGSGHQDQRFMTREDLKAYQDWMNRKFQAAEKPQASEERLTKGELKAFQEADKGQKRVRPVMKEQTKAYQEWLTKNFKVTGLESKGDSEVSQESKALEEVRTYQKWLAQNPQDDEVSLKFQSTKEELGGSGLQGSAQEGRPLTKEELNAYQKWITQNPQEADVASKSQSSKEELGGPVIQESAQEGRPLSKEELNAYQKWITQNPQEADVASKSQSSKEELRGPVIQGSAQEGRPFTKEEMVAWQEWLLKNSGGLSLSREQLQEPDQGGKGQGLVGPSGLAAWAPFQSPLVVGSRGSSGGGGAERGPHWVVGPHLALLYMAPQQRPSPSSPKKVKSSKYNFGYRVQDSGKGTEFGQTEAREGLMTKGEYHVLLPDGRMQEVRYWAAPSSGYHVRISYHDHASSENPPSPN